MILKFQVRIFLLFLFAFFLFSCKKENNSVKNDVKNKQFDWFLEKKNNKNQVQYHSKFLSEYNQCIENKQFENAKLLLSNYGQLTDKMHISDSLFIFTSHDFLTKNINLKKDSLLAYLHCYTAINYHRINDHENAIIYADNALELNKILKSRLINEKANNLKGNCYMFTNQYNKAIKTFTDLIVIAEQYNDYKSLGSLNNNLAFSYSMLNAYNEADKKFKKSAESYLKAKDSMRYFALQFSRFLTDFDNKNDTLRTLKKLDSLCDFHKTYKNSEEVNDIILAELKIRKYYLSKQPDSAFYYNNIVKNYYQAADGYVLENKLYDIKIHFQKYKKLKDKAETIKMVDNLLNDVRYSEVAELYSLLSENAKSENNFEEALQFKNKEIVLKDSILKANQKGQLFEFDKKYQSEKKEKQIAQQQIQISKNKSYIFGLLLALTIIVLGTILYYTRKRKQEAKAETLRQEQFTFQLFQNTEDERSRIANELHDSVNHDLLNIKNNLINGKTISANDVANVIEEVRNISRNLHPAVLESVGLEAIIENLCERLSEIGLFTTYEITYSQKLSKNKELQLYRIIQEALNNTLKHGKANAAKVMLTSQNNILYLEIKDNGSGFDVNQQLKNPNSFGLQSILQRAKAIAAKIDITSNNLGTKILLKIPT